MRGQGMQLTFAASALLLLLCISSGFTQGLGAQGGSGAGYKSQHQYVPRLVLSLADPEVIIDAHGVALGHHARNIRHVAAPGFVEADIVDAGLWEDFEDGSRVWRMAVQTPGAESQILVFRDVHLPQHASLRLCAVNMHKPEQEYCLQYTADDIDASGRLVVPVIPGEVVVCEYFQSAMSQPHARPRLVLTAVLQGLPTSLAETAQRRRRRRRRVARRLTAAAPPAAAAASANAAAPAPDYLQQQQLPLAPDLGPVPPQEAQGTQFNVDQIQRTTDGVTQCTPSVECAPDWAQEAASVVDIYAIDLNIGSMGFCTGTIINAPQGEKFLLTADHCFIDKTDISTFQWWVLIFNYEMPCRSTQTPPPIKQVIQGTKLLFYDSHADVLLLQIPNSIPDHFGAYKIGFDAAAATPNRAVAIHHPAGNIKRISYANSSDSIQTAFQPPTFSEDVHPTDQTHFQVTWTQGATEGGSSGAALIDADTRKVVGVLTGGTTTCDVFSGADYFGKLSVAWQNGLQNFLSDVPSLLGSGQGVSAITQYGGGVVVVDSLGGAPNPRHGPAIDFWPPVFVIGPDNVTRVAFYLTDSPSKDEVIHAMMSLKGDLPGNQVDPLPHVELSTYAFNFTADNCCTDAQPLDIATVGLGSSVPGDLLRLQIVFWLTSSTNSSYLHISAMKGVIQSGFYSWTQLQPVACIRAPCNFVSPIVEGGPPTYPLPTRAVFRFVPNQDTSVAQDVCLQSGVLDQATVSVYINGTFTWTLSESYDNPDCVHIPALDVPAGLAINTVISDSDDYEAVLPIGSVKSVSIYEAAQPPAAPRGSGAADVVAEVSRQWRSDSSSRSARPPAAAASAAPAPAAGAVAAAVAADSAPVPLARAARPGSGTAPPPRPGPTGPSGAPASHMGKGQVQAESVTPGPSNPFVARGNAASNAPAQTEAVKSG